MVARRGVGELGGLRRRLLGTLALLAIFGVLGLMPLPGIDPKQAIALGSRMSLLAIGVAPCASAFVTVEWAALLWPGWRRHRLSLAGREKLDRAVGIVSLALGAMQVFGVVLAIEHLNDTDPKIPLLQGNAEAFVGLSLFIGILLAFFLARAISKLGLLNGFSVLTWLQAMRLSTVHGDTSAASTPGHDPHPVALLCAFVLPLLATAVCFSKRKVTDGESEALAPFELPVPASSMHPSAFVVALLAMPAALSMFFPNAMRPLLSWLGQFGENPWMRAALTLCVGVVLLWAFGRPSRVRALYARAVGTNAAPKLAQRAFRDSIAPTLLLLLTLALSELLIETEFEIRNLTPLIPTGVAIFIDLVAAMRLHASGDWACAWRDPRPYVFPVVQRVLRSSEIPARELSLAQTTLFRIFAPYALSEVWVPAPLAAQATTLIEERLGASNDEQLEVEASELEESDERGGQRRRRLYWLAALAVVACVATLSTHR